MNADRIISVWGIGSGGTDRTRRMQFVTRDLGWAGFVRELLRPQMKAGIRRFLLFAPFGQDELRTQTVDGVSFQTSQRFDQYLLAKAMGMPWMIDGFVEAIKPLTIEGCQVIVYIGTLAGAPEYERDKWRWQQWVDDSLEPFKAANCDLAIDTLSRASADHYASQIVRSLRATSRARVYCESMPLTGKEHWTSGDVIAAEASYQNAVNPANRATLADPATIQGELIRWLNTGVPLEYSGDWRKWFASVVPSMLAQRACSIALPFNHFQAAGGTLAELVGGYYGYAGAT